MTLSRILAICGAALLLGAPVSAQTIPTTTVDALCRKDLHKTLGRLAREGVKEMNKCHTKRMRGIYEESRDCNVPENSPSPNKVQREEGKLRRRASHSCAGDRRLPASPPSQLGYTSCPAPCDGIAINDDYANVAECIICLNRALTIQLVTDTAGTPTLPLPDGAKRCQDRVGNLVKKYLSKRITDQEQCMTARELGLLDASTDCRSADLLGRVAKARNNLIANIDRCGDAALAALDGCADNVADERVCAVAAVESTVDTLFDLIYPTIPDAPDVP